MSDTNAEDICKLAEAWKAMSEAARILVRCEISETPELWIAQFFAAAIRLAEENQ